MAAWWQILRPRQWVKNLFVLAPLLFAQQLFDPLPALQAMTAAGLFCLFSASVYMLNDVADRQADRAHPLKRLRPVAAGTLSARRVATVAIVLAGAAWAAAWLLRWKFALVAGGYLVLNLLYTMWLKHWAFVDVVVIAAGFVLRVVGGAVAISVEISPWLVVCTFCLACLLALGKRRHELQTAGADTTSRSALAGYSLSSLLRAEKLTGLVTILTYLAYSQAPETVAKFGTRALAFTAVYPLFGIFRYLHLVHHRPGVAPTDALVTDPPTLINLAGWVTTVVLVLYLR